LSFLDEWTSKRSRAAADAPTRMGSSTQRRRRGLSRAGAVWIYVIALAAAAAACWIVVVHGLHPLMQPALPTWTVAGGFLCAELCVVHLQFRRSAHSFSLGDVPFVFGLVFLGGDALVIAALVGTGLVWALHRRLPPVKLAFNLTQLALAVCLAAMIVHATSGGASDLDPRAWLGLYLATITSGAVTILSIAGAIAIAEGGMRLRTLAQMFAMNAVVTLTNVSLAVTAALVVSTDARAIPVLVVPALTVFAAYRAYISERQRHEKLEFLYEANRTLSRSPEVAEALEGLLVRSLEAFRSEVAEVLLFGADGVARRTTHGPGDQRLTMVEADRAIAEELAGMVDGERPVVSLTPPFGSARLRAHFEDRGIRHAMVAMLPGEQRTMGTIMLANRFGLERAYRHEDLRLLEALANNAAVALQYDRLEQAVAKLETLQEQLHHQAYHDPLTDLPNRTLFMERVREELARSEGEAAAVLFIDVDDFKTVNDSLGHGVGDALLVSVAERLRSCVRPEDIVARLGGDEFAIMIPGVSDPLAQGRRVARRILDGFRMPVQAGPELVSVHLSVGIADSRHGEDGDELVRNADVAMYQAKSKGKARYEHFEPSMADAILRRHDLKEELAKAIEREQLVVQYQPIVSLETGQVTAAEALVRWEHPVRGLVPPSEFVPLAEETGLIVPIGRHVMREACRQAVRWQEAGDGERLRMHVNLSVVELHDPGAVKSILRSLEATGLNPGQLVLEITESQLIGDAAASARRFQELRELGVRIALDDFGTGYSSLSYLHSLPLDALKIAKPFVDGLLSDGREASFAAMIVDLARTLELEVIAEGIETAEQVGALRALGAELGQGYLFARPSAAAPGRLATA
jgi:diguanylate cyclase (GGDEF)-like protein